MERRVAWPPRVIKQTALGILRDASDENYPRDIGRSTQFSNGHVVVQFGDTFDEKGRFLAAEIEATPHLRRRLLPTSNMKRNRWNLDNTCAIVVDPENPTLSRYKLNASGKVGEFIEQLPGEFPPFTRNKLWSFSGIVETGSDAKGIIHGYTWFRAERTCGPDQNLPAGPSRDFVKVTGYVQIGVAKVQYDPLKREIKTLRTELEAKTFDNWLNPSFGYTCALKVDSHIYLYGQTIDGKKDIMLARVPVAKAELFENFEFWAGADWSKNVKDCKPVMRRIEHGQIFATKAFGKFSQFRYCFVGCSSDGDSRVQMARAKSPEGPWDDGYELNMDLYKSYFKQKDPKYFYCMYPHPWALGWDTPTKAGLTVAGSGELMITWSEGGLDGHVMASAVKFEMKESRYEDWASSEPEADDIKWNHGPDSSPGHYGEPQSFGTGGNVPGGATYGGSFEY